MIVEAYSMKELQEKIYIPYGKTNNETIKELYAHLATPSYVHGYSLAIQYMYNWFESKFEKNFFKGGIYIDGKHVLDDYKFLNKHTIRKENPKARIAPTVEFDYDREMLDAVIAPPDIYLRRSKAQDSFFKDYDNKLFLSVEMRALRMNFNFKIRVNSRSQQLDLFNRMELYFRVGATQYEEISVDFHIPKHIILAIAKEAGFKIKNNEVVNVIEFINYFNKHSDLPFLFKIRAINQKPEFFIRVKNLYTHIAVRDKLSLDDGERIGKLDTNFHIELNATLTIPIPHYYGFYSAGEIMKGFDVYNEDTQNSYTIYSINVMDFPKVNNKGWQQAAISEYLAEQGEDYIDISSLFKGDNLISRAIKHQLTNYISPSSFLDVRVWESGNVGVDLPITVDWNTFRILLDGPVKEKEKVFRFCIYCDKEFINNLDIALQDYNNNRISKK